MIKSITTQLLLGSMAGFLFAGAAQAADLNGAWANDTSVCPKLFVMKNNRLSMSTNSDFYGSGFIVEGDEVRGKLASCGCFSRISLI